LWSNRSFRDMGSAMRALCVLPLFAAACAGAPPEPWVFDLETHLVADGSGGSRVTVCRHGAQDVLNDGPVVLGCTTDGGLSAASDGEPLDLYRLRPDDPYSILAADVPTDDPGAVAEVDWETSDCGEAHVDLKFPIAPTITSPAEGSTVSMGPDGVEIAWQPAGLDDEIEYRLETDCEGGTTWAVRIPDTGRYTIPETYFWNDDDTCSVTIGVARVSAGTLTQVSDPSYCSFTSVSDAKQERFVSFSVVR
jgi:hypothetical protein